MEIDKIAMGKRIRQIRKTNTKKLNATMEEFAELIGSGKSNVSKWERGQNIPTEGTLRDIAKLGGISVNELLYGTIDEFIEDAVREELKQILSEDGALQGDNQSFLKMTPEDINKARTYIIANKHLFIDKSDPDNYAAIHTNIKNHLSAVVDFSEFRYDKETLLKTFQDSLMYHMGLLTDAHDNKDIEDDLFYKLISPYRFLKQLVDEEISE